MIRKNRIPLYILLGVLLVFGLIWVTGFSLGDYISCVQDYGTSFPCQDLYDLYLYLILIGLAVVAILWILIRLVIGFARREFQ